MLNEKISRRAATALLLTLAVACGTSSAATEPPSPNNPDPGTPPPGGVSPGVVAGIATDANGQPIAGARIWVRPAVTTGLLQATTGTDGRYRVQGLSTIPYHAYAWTTFQYRGKPVCLRLASTAASDYDSFVPTQGAVRNFRLQLDGEIEVGSGEYFGGELRLFVPARPAGMKLMVTFTPDGPLVDGGAGRTITREITESLQKNLPVGVYKVTAAFVGANGQRIPLTLNTDGGSEYAPETTLQWTTDGSCVGSTGSGPDRAFLWIDDVAEE